LDFFTRLTFALHGDTFKVATISFDIKVFARLNSPHSLQVCPLEKKVIIWENKGHFRICFPLLILQLILSLTIHAVTRHMSSIGWFDHACHRNPSLLRTFYVLALIFLSKKKVTSPLL